MSEIQWTDATWNPVVGCSPVSEGCRNCYAAKHAIRLGANPNTRDAYEGTAEMRGTGSDRRAVFTGVVRTLPDRLDQPLRWRKPRRVFVNSMSDLFHKDVPFEFIDRVFAVMALCPQHTYQVLTKRPERMAEWATTPTRSDAIADEATRFIGGQLGDDAVYESIRRRWPLPNVWLGTSVEDQAAADERIPHLLRTPAAVRFLSCEPLLGPVDLRNIDYGDALTPTCCPWASLDDGPEPCAPCRNGEGVKVDWVIVGGESGPGARPCDVAWLRSFVEQCQAARVPVFVKQLGADPRVMRAAPTRQHPDSEIEYAVTLRDRKGGDPDEWPEDLRVREFPSHTEAKHR